MKTIPAVVSDRIILDDEVQTITGVSPRTARELESRGEFPRSRRVGARRKGRLLSELVAWVQSRPVLPLPEPRAAATHDNDDANDEPTSPSASRALHAADPSRR